MRTDHPIYLFLSAGAEAFRVLTGGLTLVGDPPGGSERSFQVPRLAKALPGKGGAVADSECDRSPRDDRPAAAG